jgi:PAS domain S-box-containing protein
VATHDSPFSKAQASEKLAVLARRTQRLRDDRQRAQDLRGGQVVGSSPVGETFFAEMKRYVAFGPEDEAALRGFHPHATPHFRGIAEEFYERLSAHPEAVAVFSGPEQLERLKSTLCVWMDLLLTGPWDEDYYEKRARIGRMHVKISLPQRYMFGAMDAIRISFGKVVHATLPPEQRMSVLLALHKIIDVELAIMLETYRESFVDKVQQLERLEKTLLERRLAISEARYAQIVETAGALVVTFGASGTIQFANRQARELGGDHTPGDDWFERFVSADRGNAVRRDCARLLRDGTPLPAFETSVATRAGDRRVRWHVTLLPGSDAPSLLAIGIDITEEHALSVRTRRAERLASLGTMAAGLAHEIRNPLNAAHLQLTLLKRRLAKVGDAAAGATEAAELAAGEMKRLATLVEEFLQFARPQPLRIGVANLRSTAETVVTLLAPVAEAAGVELVLEPGPSVALEIDEEKIKQVLHNLVRNAIEAARDAGTVHVRIGDAPDEAVLEVEDSGPGIQPPDAPIFEPFYTSKSEGTGLGLAIVLRIATDHGGRIDVESRPGKTRFILRLPLTQGTQTLRVG